MRKESLKFIIFWEWTKKRYLHIHFSFRNNKSVSLSHGSVLFVIIVCLSGKTDFLSCASCHVGSHTRTEYLLVQILDEYLYARKSSCEFVLTKIGMYWQVLVKFLNIRFHGNVFTSSRCYMHLDGWTEQF
jgi:hypothetical protein